jgi:hypothetical protein
VLEHSVTIIKDGNLAWNRSANFEIEHYPWDDSGYTPKVACKFLLTEDRFHLMFEAHESNIRAEVSGTCAKVGCNSPKPASLCGFISFTVSSSLL